MFVPERGRVLVSGRFEPDERERIRTAAAGVPVDFVDGLGDRTDLLGTATVIAGTLSGEQLALAPAVRWVHSWAAGVNNDLAAGLDAHPAVLTSSAGNGAVPLAEHAMMLMLMLNRDAPRWARAQSERRWERFQHGELNGLTCGIIGLGNCGLDLAAKARAFHMRVVGVRRRTDLPSPGVDAVHPPEDLHRMLAESDFVVVTAPDTPATEHLLGEAELRAMKDTAYVVVVSRGGIVADGALLRALTEGWIAGAGLDAHGREPLPPDSPFWDLPNVIVTPHNGATTAATRRRGVDVFVENLERHARGRPLVNVVDKSAGY
ncbi:MULTISPECIES: D-2-hydroxyacid dehydrogenase [Nocardiopsis]|uniref:D-isomer specific 2-hydroxyacid dehydrogenase NAD-binding protein n=2 Tax=Nocardiopsis TaxID=2013 RepID=D7AXC5_NOCDD|nr:D-2-hydroxyacid dehydrogenase [Nocardiopsis dassonvillei]ADH65999.1 D-isomer specific 2-hydroxyacid dehydrogenase NAD-binding protein [Nocardiopsis dassonvillei subsp. dassonvillei DSM 43111]APC34340.1 hydroxyacid dehydrogenase [Nocardiopsis dassonvillei]NKY79019.1 D-2-hydroxyacid dehydrogenase [Nocardiopsis dassonvillei]VEI92020.1 Glycerate dehydrogenase [Nocardiopsis dassonvillei]